ncbi:MAG: LLM class flavin-dependent oxidoreductase [SAR324 cluster bacterium]
MKIGLYLTNQQHVDVDLVSALDEQIAMLHLARDGGFESLFTGQHYLNEGNNVALQAVPFLARLAAEAGEMTLGLGVLLLPLHNPVYVAETVATLDVICRGNFVLGVGLGYRDVEFNAFAVPKAQRARRFEEGLALVRRLWTEDEVTFDSAYCRLERVHMNLRPVQKPHPPVWIGGNNEPAIRRAARLGDAWFTNPSAPVAVLAKQLAAYRTELTQAGRPAPREIACFREVFCARDRQTALAAAGPSLAAKYQDYSRWGQDPVTRGTPFAGPFEEMARDAFVLGSPEECFRALEELVKMGFNHLVLRNHWPGLPLSAALGSLRLLAREVLPALRKV